MEAEPGSGSSSGSSTSEGCRTCAGVLDGTGLPRRRATGRSGSWIENSSRNHLDPWSERSCHPPPETQTTWDRDLEGPPELPTWSSFYRGLQNARPSPGSGLELLTESRFPYRFWSTTPDPVQVLEWTPELLTESGFWSRFLYQNMFRIIISFYGAFEVQVSSNRMATCGKEVGLSCQSQ